MSDDGRGRSRRSRSDSSRRSRKLSRSASRSPLWSRSNSRSRSLSSDEEDGLRLHIADLGMSVSKSELESIFERYGPLKEVWVARCPPCFAFIVFKDKEDAEDALRGSDGMSIGGNRIRVTVARPRTRGRGIRGYDPNMRCYQCGRRGHFSRDCSESKYGYKRPRSRSFSPPPRRRPNRRDNYYGRRRR